MVRTAATAVRASGGKSSKAAKTSTLTSCYSSSTDRHTIGGNPVHPREIPAWQKPITSFFTKQPHDTYSKEVLEQKKQDNQNLEFMGEKSDMTNTANENPTDEKNIFEKNYIKKDISVNQSDIVLEDENISAVANKKTNVECESDDNKVPKRKPNLDFYKHLEEIEKYTRDDTTFKKKYNRKVRK